MSNSSVLHNRNGLVLSDDGKRVIRYFGNSQKKVVVPDGVTDIGHFAFGYNDEIRTVVLPSSVRVIEAYAFADCTRLRQINIPSGVKDIGMCAFRDCKSLFTVNIPDSVENVGYCAFYGCTAGLPAKWRTEAITGIEPTVSP